MSPYAALATLFALAGYVLGLRWLVREKNRAGVEAWRDMKAGILWAGHEPEPTPYDVRTLQRNTVRMLQARAQNRS